MANCARFCAISCSGGQTGQRPKGDSTIVLFTPKCATLAQTLLTAHARPGQPASQRAGKQRRGRQAHLRVVHNHCRRPRRAADGSGGAFAVSVGEAATNPPLGKLRAGKQGCRGRRAQGKERPGVPGPATRIPARRRCSRLSPASRQKVKAFLDPGEPDRPQRGYNSFVPLEPMNQLQANMKAFASGAKPYPFMLIWWPSTR